MRYTDDFNRLPINSRSGDLEQKLLSKDGAPDPSRTKSDPKPSLRRRGCGVLRLEPKTRDLAPWSALPRTADALHMFTFARLCLLSTARLSELQEGDQVQTAVSEKPVRQPRTVILQEGSCMSHHDGGIYG